MFSRKKIIACYLLIAVTGCAGVKQLKSSSLPQWMKGKFTDDYGISYTINDSMFVLEPSDKYHLVKWNKEEQYLLARNSKTNKTNKGLYTRIDYMDFIGMEPYSWGFCLTVYDAKDSITALQAPPADRNTPRKGCNGFPFSRMKRSQ